MRVAMLLAGLIAEATGAQASARLPVSQAALVTLSPAAAGVVARFAADTADARATVATLSNKRGVVENLAARVEIDQALRGAA